jgi:hypothetical protein
VAQTEDGYLWVGTTAGLFRFDGVHFAEEEDAPMVGRGGAMPSVYRSTDGSLWISGFSGANKGLVRLKDQRAETIDPSARVRAITEDEKGILWYSKSDPQAGKEEICSWVHGSRPRCPRQSRGVSFCTSKSVARVRTMPAGRRQVDWRDPAATGSASIRCLIPGRSSSER